MKFWDSSAIIPLLIEEARTAVYRDQLKADMDGMVAWWGSPVECVSAIARKARERLLSEEEAAAAVMRLNLLQEAWTEVEPTEEVRRLAKRFLRVHDLRAADALQLAAARVVAGDDDSGKLVFLTEDSRLRDAAVRDGFRV
jgi:predicted nucleic acid-binding protein